MAIITNKELEELLIKYKNGNDTLLIEILDKTSYLIDDVIKNQIYNETYDYELLFELGKFALIDAVKNYNGNKDFKYYAKLSIYYKLKNHLERYPNPGISKDNNVIYENINKILNINLKKQDYLYIRALIESESARAKICIKERFGYNGKCLSVSEIASKYRFNEEAVNNALNRFKNTLLEKYSDMSSKKIVVNKEELSKEFLKPSIFDYFVDSKEDVIWAVSMLPRKNVIYLKYGINLDQNNEIDTFNNNLIANELIKEINLILSEIKSYNFSILSHFKGFSKEQISYAITKLPSIYKDLVYMRYGTDLNKYNMVSHEVVKTINNIIIPELKDILNNIVNKDINKFFSEFTNFTREEVLAAIINLPKTYQSIIYSRYGSKLNEFNTISFSDIVILENNIIPLILKTLNKIKNNLNIFTVLDCHNKELLKKNLLELNNDYQILIYKRFVKKEEFSFDELKKLYLEALPELKGKIISDELLLKQAKRKRSGGRPLLELLSAYSKEEIIIAVNKLDSESKELVFKKYGQNLNEYHKLSDYDTIIYNQKNILRTLKRILSGKKRDYQNVSLLELLKDYSKEEIFEAVSKLDDKSKSLLYKKFGNGLDECHKLASDEARIYHDRKIFNTLRQILKQKTYKKHATSLFELLSDYSKEEIVLAVSKLDDERKNLLYQKYGANLDEYHKLSGEINIVYRNKDVIKTLRKVLNGKKISRIKHNLFELLSDYSKEEILKVYAELSIDEKKILISKYGANLDEYHKLDANLNNKLFTLINKMRRKMEINRNPLLERPKENKRRDKTLNGKGFFENFTEFDREDVLRVLNTLEEHHKVLIYKKYGQNLDEKHPLNSIERNQLHYILYKIMVDKLNGIESKYKKRIPFFEYFTEFDREEVINVLDTLEEHHKALIYKKYGLNLDENNSINRKESNQIHYIIHTIIPDKLNHKKKKAFKLMDYFDGYSKEEIRKAVEILNPKYQAIFYKKFGYNLEENNSLSKSEKDCLHQTIIKKLKLKLEGKELSEKSGPKPKNLLEKYPSKTKEEIVNAIETKLSLEERNLIYLKYGLSLMEDNDVSPRDKSKLKYIVNDKLAKILSSGKNNTLLSYFKDISYEELIKTLRTLSFEEQKLIIRKYGQNLNENNELSVKEERKINIICQKIRQVIDGNILFKAIPLSILINMPKDEYLSIINSLKLEEKDALFKYYGYDLESPSEIPYNVDLIIFVQEQVLPKLKKILLVNINNFDDAYKTIAINVSNKKDIVYKLGSK